MILFTIFGIVGMAYPQKPPAPQAAPPHLEFKQISDLPTTDGMFMFELPSKQGYIFLVLDRDGASAVHSSVTYIPRDVRWEGTAKK